MIIINISKYHNILYLKYVLWDENKIYAAKSQLRKAQENVDYTPEIDPLDSILQANENDEAMKEAKGKWGKTIDIESLKGTKTISLQAYKEDWKKSLKNLNPHKRKEDNWLHLGLFLC